MVNVTELCKYVIFLLIHRPNNVVKDMTRSWFILWCSSWSSDPGCEGRGCCFCAALLYETWEKQKREWSDLNGTMQDRQMVFTFQAWSGVCVCCASTFFYLGYVIFVTWTITDYAKGFIWLVFIIFIVLPVSYPQGADKMLDIALLIVLRDLSKHHKYLTCYLYKWSDLHLG